MKHILVKLIVIFLFGFNLFSQNTKTQLTEFAEITFPSETELNETGNDKVFVSEDSTAIYMVSIRNFSNRNFPSFNQNELLDFYEGVINGTVNSANGELIKSEKIELANSVAMDIEYTANSNPNLPNRRFKRIFLFKKNLFNVEFWPIIKNQQIIDFNKSKFYNSFSVSNENSNTIQNSQIESSTNKEQSTDYENGFSIGKIFFYLLLLVVSIIIILIFVINSRKKKTHPNQNSHKTQKTEITQVNCSKCQTENKSDFKYCKNCGYELK